LALIIKIDTFMGRKNRFIKAVSWFWNLIAL